MGKVNEYLEADSCFTSYPNDKSILGKGSFGIVFATRRDDVRVAVKVIPASKNWKTTTEIKRMESEVRPMIDSKRLKWKHVIWAYRAFVHEQLITEVRNLSKPASADGSLSASTSEVLFWRLASEHLLNF